MWSKLTKAGNTEYHERYKDPLTGKNKVATVTLEGTDTKAKQKLAMQELARIIAEKQTLSETADLTLSELKDRYINYQKKTVKQSTWMRNSLSLKVCVNQIGPDIKVDRLTAGFIRDRLLERTTDPTTVNEYIKRVKAMLRWGYDSDYTDNISAIRKLKRLKDDRANSSSMKPEDKYLEPEQLQDILHYMQKKQEYWYLLTKFLVLSGLRIGEAMALHKDDIVDEDIIVSKTYDSYSKQVTTPKTVCSNRKVYIQPELAEVIREIRIYDRNRELLLGVRTDLLFHDDTGAYISYPSYCKFVREVSTRIIGVRRTPHSFRHTHASLLFAEGVSIDTISRRLGHENSKITHDIYLHIVEKVKERDRIILSDKRLIS